MIFNSSSKLKVFPKYFLKFFKPDGYIYLLTRVIKRIHILKLLLIKFSDVSISPVWIITSSFRNVIDKEIELMNYNIFRSTLSLANINWHRDISSGYTYPLLRIDKIKLSKTYDKNTDVLFVWVQSRFYFAVYLAQMYLNTGNENYYLQFKRLVLDWIDKNPFLYGVNWLSPMEAAIRTINWITAINLFGKLFSNDKEFNKVLSISLQQHTEFISRFPEIYKNGLTTNHTTSDYAGLLFLSLALKDHIKSNKWLEQSITGLLKCIDSQIYDDGVDFEGSIPYHRLVLELFAYSAIICLSNHISLPVSYYSKLFKMFEYTAAYMDKNGNAPSVGDDDSGRILVFNEINEPNFYKSNTNHSYLLELGEYIFNYRFLHTPVKNYYKLSNYQPSINKINVDSIPKKETDKSIKFEKGGAYFLKDDRFDFMLICFPVGQNGNGGHNHFDTGSFTLSIDGEEIIVDPGTGVYSPDKKKRDQFRAYKYHNTIYNSSDEKYSLNKIGIWEYKSLYTGKIVEFSCNSLDINIESQNDPFLRRRQFQIKDDEFTLIDSYKGYFFSRINFHPDINILSINSSSLITNKCKILLEGAKSFFIDDYEYSGCYQNITKAKYLNTSAKNELKIIIKILR